MCGIEHSGLISARALPLVDYTSIGLNAHRVIVELCTITSSVYMQNYSCSKCIGTIISQEFLYNSKRQMPSHNNSS